MAFRFQDRPVMTASVTLRIFSFYLMRASGAFGRRLSSLGRILLDRVLCQIAESGEGGGIVNRSLGEHLAVHVQAGDLQAVHKAGIVHAVGLAAGGDTGDPELTEVSLLLLPQ